MQLDDLTTRGIKLRFKFLQPLPVSIQKRLQVWTHVTDLALF